MLGINTGTSSFRSTITLNSNPSIYIPIANHMFPLRKFNFPSLQFTSESRGNSKKFVVSADGGGSNGDGTGNGDLGKDDVKGKDRGENEFNSVRENNGGGGNEEEVKKGNGNGRPRFSFRWVDLLLDPDPDNVLAVGLTGLLTWASVQVLWQLFFISFAILLSALKYSFIAALLIFILIALL